MSLSSSDIIYLNCSSYLAHKDQIIADIFSFNPVVVVLSETRCTADVEDSELQICGYYVVRCDSNSRYTGGVLVYIKHGAEYSLTGNYVLDFNYWCQFLDVKVNGTRWSVGAVYHSPNASHSVFLDKVEEWCEYHFCNQKCILVGDFNLDYLNGDSFTVINLKTLYRFMV